VATYCIRVVQAINWERVLIAGKLYASFWINAKEMMTDHNEDEKRVVYLRQKVKKDCDRQKGE
jgi:hypothetical protein